MKPAPPVTRKLMPQAKVTVWNWKLEISRQVPWKPVSTQHDLLRQVWTKVRTGQGFGSCTEETHRAGLCADPNLLCACVKIQRHLLLNLRFRIARRKHFHANLRRPGKANPIAKLAHAFRRSPGHVGSLHAVGSGNRTFCENSAARH